MPGEFIPWETHSDNDQFIRVEQGKASIKLKQPSKGSKITQVVVREDEYIVINAGVAHFVENPEPVKSLKMYIVYAGKPEHARGTLQVRQDSEVFRVEEEYEAFYL
jgi:mannose-6-phosphate isomerase-like protein (cupin superfamily)